MKPAPGLVIRERYRLTRSIGEGAMGEVWLAHNLTLEIPCAIKFIHDWHSDNPEVLRRFEREGRATAQLASTHVVRIFDSGNVDGTPYIAMELLEGEPLSVKLQRQGRLDPSETMRVVDHVGRALARAHRAGIVHRDLKPANVFVVHDPVDGEICKVVDFGVAKEQGLNLTHTGMLMGTPAFMSPEQAVGSTAVDHRADLWALGVLAFRCLTGRNPFPQRDKVKVLLAIVKGELPVPSAVQPDIPPGFDAWWARACARAPDQRFQSAMEQVDALREALGLEPALRAPTPPAPALLGATVTMGPAATVPGAPQPARSAMESTLRPAATTRVVSPPRQRAWIVVTLAALVVLGVAGLVVLRGIGEETVDSAAPQSNDPGDAPTGTAEPSAALPPVPEPPPPAASSASTPKAQAPAPVPRRPNVARPPPLPLPLPLPPPPAPAPAPAPKDRVGF